ncbi:hypothetical protein [Selenomonas sp. AE3005]|uniref:hypothetical protein n=1 Tax=Selenomonas sp. AE3005 TaxID=1485543 RepID=UPI0025D709D4|nr:hypothetical protein [Selenomonas sp. AE3005]
MENENKKFYAEQKVIDTLTEKKIEGYSSEKDNFVIPQELTVTITLNEYRGLIKENALKEHDIDKVKSDNWKLKSRIDELEMKNKELLEKLSETISNPKTAETSTDGEN